MVKPRKPEADRRTAIFAFRVTESQKAALDDFARAKGHDPSDWARATLLGLAGLLPKAQKRR